MTKKETIKKQLEGVDVGHYTHFVMEKYNFRQITEAMGELHTERRGFYTCKQVDIAHVFIVRRDA